jgi:hypothetical protein
MIMPHLLHYTANYLLYVLPTFRIAGMKKGIKYVGMCCSVQISRKRYKRKIRRSFQSPNTSTARTELRYAHLTDRTDDQRRDSIRTCRRGMYEQQEPQEEKRKKRRLPAPPRHLRSGHVDRAPVTSVCRFPYGALDSLPCFRQAAA